MWVSVGARVGVFPVYVSALKKKSYGFSEMSSYI